MRSNRSRLGTHVSPNGTPALRRPFASRSISRPFSFDPASARHPMTAVGRGTLIATLKELEGNGNESRAAPRVSDTELRLRHRALSRTGDKPGSVVRRGKGRRLRGSRPPAQSHDSRSTGRAASDDPLCPRVLSPSAPPALRIRHDFCSLSGRLESSEYIGAIESMRLANVS